jgi:hypothetical protein
MGADDLRVASFVASNGVLQMRSLCTEFIVTCTDSLGVHVDRGDDRTRNAYLNGCSISTFVTGSAAMSVSRRRYRYGRVGRSVVDLR